MDQPNQQAGRRRNEGLEFHPAAEGLSRRNHPLGIVFVLKLAGGNNRRPALFFYPRTEQTGYSLRAWRKANRSDLARVQHFKVANIRTCVRPGNIITA
uniref:Uncharacterized protein n=1 Tax=Acrobeloides nanus TaxID=290746 RepID=A0A914DLB0_9BILA